MSALGHKIDFAYYSVAGTAADFYVPAPFDLIVTGMACSPDIDPGDADTLTVTENAVAIGVYTWGTDIAAGDTGTYVADTTTGETKINAGDKIKISVSTLAAGATMLIGHLIVDPYCRDTQ